jgi:hypothetical protein
VKLRSSPLSKSIYLGLGTVFGYKDLLILLSAGNDSKLEEPMGAFPVSAIVGQAKGEVYCTERMIKCSSALMGLQYDPIVLRI